MAKKKQHHYLKDIRKRTERNGSLLDLWSFVHLATGIFLGWVMDPFIALAIMVLWEPFEIFILSPLLAKVGIIFGYESIRNSLSDIVFNVMGVAIGAWLLTYYTEPPFYLYF